MDKLKQKWLGFVEKNPKLAKWIREGGLFFLVSNLITIIRGLLISLLEPIFAFLGEGAIGFPGIEVELFGAQFTWYVIGADSKSKFAAFFIALWVCEIINFFLQRKYVFLSKGNVCRQFLLYFLIFAFITCIVNSLDSIWRGVGMAYSVPELILSLGTTFLTGGVAMVVFFFANRFIFKDTE